MSKRELAKQARKQRIEAIATRTTELAFKRMIALPRTSEYSEVLHEARLSIALMLLIEHYPKNVFKDGERDQLIERVIVEKATELYRSGHNAGNFDVMCKALKWAETCPELCKKLDQFHDEILKDEPPISPEFLERQRVRVQEILAQYRPK